MKIHIAVTIIGLFILMNLSCKKADQFNPERSLNSSNSVSANSYQSPFGVLVSESNGETLTPVDAAALARDLGCSYARLAVTNLQ